MRIAVLGAGNIGGTLGRAWLRAGHEVRFGVRSPDKYAALRDEGGILTTATDAVSGADVVLLAVPGDQVDATLDDVGGSLAGLVVIDATNNRGAEVMHGREAVARVAPVAHYCRAFNSLGFDVFAEPTFADGERADLFFAAADGGPRATVAALVRDVGLRPVWIGGPEHADTLDGLTRVWFALALERRLGRHTALRLLTDASLEASG